MPFVAGLPPGALSGHSRGALGSGQANATRIVAHALMEIVNLLLANAIPVCTKRYLTERIFRLVARR